MFPRVIAAALCVTAIAACSGDDDADVASYTAAGNAVCDAFGADLQTARPDFDGPPTPEQAQAVATDLQPVVVDAREAFAELDTPDERHQQHAALLDALDDAIATLDEAIDDRAAAEHLADEGPPLDKPAAAAQAAGFSRCSE